MILVTGGAGFIGSHLVKALISQSKDVVVIDNFNDFYDPKIKRANIAPIIDKITLYETDIRNFDDLSAIFAKHKFSSVIHLAAMAGVRPSIKSPALYSDVNINGTINLLELCRSNNIKDFLFASSSSVYGNNKKVPFSENDNVDFPISPYAASKKAGELICHNYHHLYNINISCLRFFTVYGPSQRPEMAIHKFTREIFEGRELTMFGNGTSSRDYTYIDDIIDGVLKAHEKLNGYNIYNLGESETTTLKDLILIIGEALNKKPKIISKPLQPGDVNTTFADISKAKKELGFAPTTKIPAGIKKFTSWFTSNNS
jgi:UDP-glucuronate 4-epimerase